jgi:hypothetical protein
MGTFCGLPAALSVSVRLAVRVPESSELNFTVTVQLLPAARDEPQELVAEKSSLSLAFVTAILVKVTVAVPTLVTVTVAVAVFPDDTVPKFTLLGEILSAGCVTTSVTCAVADV